VKKSTVAEKTLFFYSKATMKPVYVIAEIGTAHSGSFEKAKQLILAAASSGADCIKFQWVYANEILHPKTGMVQLPTGTIPLYERFKQLEVSPVFFEEAMNFVHSLNKDFMCSPFGIQSLEELFSLKPDFIKIASPELNHFPMLHRLLELEKEYSSQNENHFIPVVLSSGVSTMEDICKAISILEPLQKGTSLKGQPSLSLLHCVTSYPSPSEEYNVSVLKYLSKQFDIPVGISDHSLNPLEVPLVSTTQGGTIIEKHITLSRKTEGLDDPVALEPSDFAMMTHSLHKIEKMTDEEAFEHCISLFGKEKTIAICGNGIKDLAPSEKANYTRTNRSIHYMRDMKKGDVLTSEDIKVLRTEKILSPGISPEHYESVLGKVLSKNVEDGQGLQWEDLLSQ
jgi:sialic acid synthase SpsE